MIKKLKYEFKFFLKEEPLGILCLLASILFTILYCLYDNTFIDFLSLIFTFSLAYYTGRFSVKLENNQCQ